VDLACGCGRDAVFFALYGADVTAIDILPDALEQGYRIAKRHQVAVRFVQSDLEAGPGSWDSRWEAIHVHRFLHRPDLPLLIERLAPGGWLLVSTFLEQQARIGRRPTSPTHLLRPGELARAARVLEIAEYTEGLTDTGDWMASLVARRRP
jgi:SAM-dependent methyltransferase